MKRTTIFADEVMLSSIRQIAAKEGMSIAEVIRLALDRFIAEKMGKGKRRPPSFLRFGRSGRKDIAERSEELLWKSPPIRRKTL